MKKYILCLITVVAVSCSKSSGVDSAERSQRQSSLNIPCGTYNGNTLYSGPRDGCFYINTAGQKTHVDISECKCR